MPRVGPDLSCLRGKRVLIALSGGADSVALTAMLAEARPALGLTLFAAHLDHGIRPESAGDAAWCRALCEGLNIPFYARRVDVPALAAESGEGLETVARRLRHDWLRQLRAELGADCVALAHHLDDQAETVLMHLCRGAGPEGITGMAAVSGTLVRPLLSLRKRELIDYLNRRGLSWREDATNAVADNPRNALRLRAIPELEKIYPSFAVAAARYAQSARIESDYVAEQARQWLYERLSEGPFGQYLSLKPPAPPALLRRAIRALCGEDLGWDKLNAVAALAEAERGVCQVNGLLTVERGHRGLYFLRKAATAMPEAPLVMNGKTRLPGLCEIEAEDAAPVPVRDDAMRQVLDAGALCGAVLRTRRPGDRIRPLGCGDKLLSDYLTDKKVDRPLRDCIPLVAAGNRVLWACGLGIAAEAALTAGTARAVALRCKTEYDIRL